MFEIGPTGSLQTAQKVDRESDEIANMLVSQYIVKIKVSTKGQGTLSRHSLNLWRNQSTPSQYLYADSSGRDWITLDGSLSNAYDQTTVAVIVDDVNDNDPEFTAGPKITVGYPVKELVKQVSPPYLTIVKVMTSNIVNAIFVIGI